MKYIFPILTLFLSALLPQKVVASYCYLMPPQEWDVVQPEKDSYVQIGFLGKGVSSFRPSINLATESVDVSLKEYIRSVKKIHQEAPGTQWRDLGKLTLGGIEGRLTEISSSSPLGKIKMLQAFCIQEQTAYIITAASLQKEFLTFQKEFLSCIQSIRWTEDLCQPLVDPHKKELLQQQIASLGSFSSDAPTDQEKQEQWKTFQKTVEQQGVELGPHWQHLVLQEGRQKIFR